MEWDVMCLLQLFAGRWARSGIGTVASWTPGAPPFVLRAVTPPEMLRGRLILSSRLTRLDFSVGVVGIGGVGVDIVGVAAVAAVVLVVIVVATFSHR